MNKKGRPAEVDDVERWNTEDASDLERPANLKTRDITVASRDWTVETIVKQVKSGNIDLDPAFQRRNAWRDPRRSRLIESFILGFPVPQIVLAENPRRRGQFIVIDGKQRLLTISGFYIPEYRGYWTQPKFSGLNVLQELNRVTIDDFLRNADYAAERRQLENADIRTTVISGFQGEDVLFDIFYRINTGSVPLSSQELRQALHPGDFSKYLIQVTNEKNALWEILRISAPDPRLRDVELLLRLIAWRRSARGYKGNMKAFLDDTMNDLNRKWGDQRQATEQLVAQILRGIEATGRIFGEHAGRKFKDGVFETSLNRALFEVQAFYLSFNAIRSAAIKKISPIRRDPFFSSSLIWSPCRQTVTDFPASRFPCMASCTA
jgi:hypothetical protein